MPFYDYYCSNEECGNTFELFLPMSRVDEPITKPCPECKKNTIVHEPAAPLIGDPVRLGVTRAPSDFQKYVLGKIQAKHPKHNMDRRHSITKEV
jgi:putative FmdB family regulatory protein